MDFLLKLSYFYCIIHHEKKISSGQGDRNPWKSKFPTGGIVRDPRNAADLVTGLQRVRIPEPTVKSG